MSPDPIDQPPDHPYQTPSEGLQMQAMRERLARLHRDEHGEGVISSAVAVLVTAFLGAGMWLVFSNLMGSASDTACEQVATIGGGSGGADCDGPTSP